MYNIPGLLSFLIMLANSEKDRSVSTIPDMLLTLNEHTHSFVLRAKYQLFIAYKVMWSGTSTTE